MPVYRLDERIAFPPPELADDSGVLAVGGDLRPQRLLLAYSLGIFPWYNRGMPILWHSPDPRMAMRPRDLHVPRSLAKAMRRQPYTIKLDTAFESVIAACALTPRPGQDDTWITQEMLAAYVHLYELGFAHSVEAWAGDDLVGGLYGVSLGGVFFGESMFAWASDASKLAFVALVRQLEAWEFSLIDCQVHTDHLERFGAGLWPRADFLAELAVAVDRPTRRGPWQLELDLIDT